MNKQKKSYNDWKQERDLTIDYLKSRRTQDGGIIADDLAIQTLRDLYAGPPARNGNQTKFTGFVPGSSRDLIPSLIFGSTMLVLCLITISLVL